MTMLLAGWVIVAFYAAVVLWLLRRRKRRTPVTPERPVPERLRWSAYAGALYAFTGFCVILSLVNRRLWPEWLPPQAILIPMMLAQICSELAIRPPVRR